MSNSICIDACVDTENGLSDRVICPSCKSKMEEMDWGHFECGGDNCWQTVRFRCPKCGKEKKMNSVYTWAGFEEVY